MSTTFGSHGIAVITGAGYGGIGFATALLLIKEYNMRVMLVDNSLEALDRAEAELLKEGVSGEKTLFERCDVSIASEVEALATKAFAYGPVELLFLNAGRSLPTKNYGGVMADELKNWNGVLNTNLFGVLNGVQAFVARMVAHDFPSRVVVTGSKQGITLPPGNPAYNVSKAAVKALTESLAHSLISTSVTAHLLVPGYTFTNMTSGGGVTAGREKPRAAWSAGQVAEELLTRMLKGDFYIICADNDVSEALDFARIEWNVNDILQHRPALSRWHPDHQAAFEEYLRTKGL